MIKPYSFIGRPVVRLELIGDGEVSTVVVCHELSDMENYFQPHAPGMADFPQI